MMMEIDRLIPEVITIPPRLRPLNQQSVKALAESMASIGLLSPIIIYTPDNGENVFLVAGAHRLAAALSLGWEFIDCFCMDVGQFDEFDEFNEIDIQLTEIDENLCRHELTPTEVAEHVAKRKELWEARKAQPGQAVPLESKREDGKGHMPEGFAAETAKASGQSKRDVNRAVKRGNEVCQEARDLIRGTKLDTGAMLDTLVKLEPQQQVECVTDQINNPHRERPVSRGTGIRYAHDAIAILNRIPLSDGLRQDAFDMVIDWIETNRGSPK